MKISSIKSIEGNRQRLDGGAMFGNAPKAVWSRWVNPDKNNQVPLACRALLITLNNGKHILFETGIGAFFDPKLKERYGVIEPEHCLIKNLAAFDVSHEDIDIIILSHLHFDHAGGLFSAWKENESPRLLFPNAQFWVSQEQWQRANHPHLRDKASYIPALNQQLKDSGRLYLVEEGAPHSLEDLVSFSFSNGHTPGLMLSHIETDAGTLIFCSDLIPGQHWVHTSITMGYDRYPELLINEKEGLLKELLYQKGFLFFTHDTDMEACKVHQNEKGKFYVSAYPVNKLINVEQSEVEQS